ncbi:hypothetical protein BGZ94_005438, partial [Podila epigama]
MQRLKLAGGGNGDALLGGTAAAAKGLDFLDDLQALDDTAENGVLAIQPGGLDSADEELQE